MFSLTDTIGTARKNQAVPEVFGFTGLDLSTLRTTNGSLGKMSLFHELGHQDRDEILIGAFLAQSVNEPSIGIILTLSKGFRNQGVSTEVEFLDGLHLFLGSLN